jgi:hypothetical protein
MKDLKQFIKTTIREFVEEQKINEDIFDLIGKYPNYFNNSYVSKIADKLGYKLKINLDSGNSGVAYILDGGKVLKITTDKTEFLVANKLKGKNLKRISNIYETHKIKDQDVYIIVLEYLDSLSEELFELVEKYNETNIKKKNNPEFDWLKTQLNDIETELKNNGISNPTDFDWWMNMGLKNGNLAVFDVGDKTIDYSDFPELDISNL